jgi:ribosomal protein S16
VDISFLGSVDDSSGFGATVELHGGGACVDGGGLTFDGSSWATIVPGYDYGNGANFVISFWILPAAEGVWEPHREFNFCSLYDHPPRSQSSVAGGISLSVSRTQWLDSWNMHASIAGTSAQFETDLTNVDLRDDAQAQKFRAEAEKFKLDGENARLALMETYAFQDYAKQVQAGDFADMGAAKDAYLSVVATFNPIKASEMSVKYSSEEIARIANDGLKIQSEVSSLLQTPGPDGLNNIKAYFDDKNGDDVGVQLEIDPETGAVRMFETDAEGTNVGDLFTAANQEEARGQIQSIATYGNATAYAEQLFSRTVNEAGLSKTDAETTVLGAQADQLESQLGVDTAQIEKMDAEIAKINKTVENSDQAKSETVRQEGLQRFLGGDTYAYLQSDNPEGAKTLLQTFKYQTGMLGEREAASYEYQNGMLNMAALNEGGVSLEQYLNMSPADRAQFER